MYLFWILFAFFFSNSSLAENANPIKLPSSLRENDDDAYYPFENWSEPFDWQLLKVFADPKYKNVIISPFSLKLVLALLYEGSSGMTEKEFQKVLMYPPEKQKLRESLVNILSTLRPAEKEQFVLNVGTKMFLNSQFKPRAAFSAVAKQNYQTDVELLDFSNETTSADSINSWINKLTNGKISALVQPDELEEAVMLMINAIFFKGAWRHEFPKNRTEYGGFYITPNNVINVPLMKTTDKFFYYESDNLDAKILRLPYKGNKFAMFLILPNSRGGLNDLIKNISLDSLKKNFYYMDYIPVEVILPKFQFDFKIKLTHVLEEFGLHQMFQSTASFPGIVENITRMLFVSDIIQNSGIQLDEEGSTVFTATDVQVINKFGDIDTIFNATHPFMFFIEEQTKGTIIFAGKVENPLNTNSVSTRMAEEAQSDQALFGINQAEEDETLNLEPQKVEANAIIRRFSYFDLELLQEISELNQNIFISPASIKTTLSMILEGAGGKCAQEIGNALRIDDIEQEDIRRQLQRLLFDLNEETSNNELSTVNAVFVSNKLNITPIYRMKLERNYRAEVKPIDFANPSQSIDEINEWVNNKTKGAIQTIIGENLFEESTLVLTNVLYFRGKWKVAFDIKDTQVRCFDVPNLGCKRTPIMKKMDTLNYSLVKYLNSHAVELPYQDDKYAMLLLIPLHGTNIKILARDMQHAHLDSILDSLKPTEIILELPRFEIEDELKLAEYLKMLKIQEIFTPNANLSGIISNSNIRIGNIFHKARIEVNEKGTKAAAVTSAVVVPLMGETTTKISADIPFIFFIYQKESRNIIFEGILLEPKTMPVQQPVFKKAYHRIVPNFQNRYIPLPRNGKLAYTR